MKEKLNPIDIQKVLSLELSALVAEDYMCNYYVIQPFILHLPVQSYGSRLTPDIIISLYQMIDNNSQRANSPLNLQQVIEFVVPPSIRRADEEFDRSKSNFIERCVILYKLVDKDKLVQLQVIAHILNKLSFFGEHPSVTCYRLVSDLEEYIKLNFSTLKNSGSPIPSILPELLNDISFVISETYPLLTEENPHLQDQFDFWKTYGKKRLENLGGNINSSI